MFLTPSIPLEQAVVACSCRVGYRMAFLIRTRWSSPRDPTLLETHFGALRCTAIPTRLPTTRKSITFSSAPYWHIYSGYLNQAKKFHDTLKTCFYSKSYQFYGTDLDSPDRVEFTRENYSHLSKGRFSESELHFVNKGSFRTHVDKRDRAPDYGVDVEALITLEPPAGKGDGTVPDSSGKTLPLGEERTTKIGTDEGSWFEIGHQDIYGTPRAQEIVFTCIWNLAQKHIDDQVGPVSAC